MSLFLDSWSHIFCNIFDTLVFLFAIILHRRWACLSMAFEDMITNIFSARTAFVLFLTWQWPEGLANIISSSISKRFWFSLSLLFFSASAAALGSSLASFFKLSYTESRDLALSGYKKSSSSFSILIAWCMDSRVICVRAGRFLVCFPGTLDRKIGANNWVVFPQLSGKQRCLIGIGICFGIIFSLRLILILRVRCQTGFVTNVRPVILVKELEFRLEIFESDILWDII